MHTFKVPGFSLAVHVQLILNLVHTVKVSGFNLVHTVKVPGFSHAVHVPYAK